MAIALRHGHHQLVSKCRLRLNGMPGNPISGFSSAPRRRSLGEKIEQELRQSRLFHCEITDQLQAAREELAVWRFQCLKQKCILIDREMKLDAHNVQYEPRAAVAVPENVQLTAEDCDVDLAAVVGLGQREQEEKEEKEEKEKEERNADVDDDVVEVPLDGLEMQTIDLCDMRTVVKIEKEEEEEEQQKVKPQNVQEMKVDTLVAVKLEAEEVNGVEAAQSTLKKEVKELPSSPLVDDNKTPSKGFMANLDFLLDSPKQPQVQRQPRVVDLTEIVVEQGEANKENRPKEENLHLPSPPQKEKGGGLKKLNYKPIKKHAEKTVHFASEGGGKGEEGKEGMSGSSLLHGGILREPSKAALAGGGRGGWRPMKVNYRVIHSKPSASGEPKNGE